MTKKLSYVLISVAILVLLMASSPIASADPVSASVAFSYNGYNVNVFTKTLSLVGGSGMGTSAGSFTTSINPGYGPLAANTPFLTWCVDLGQWLTGYTGADISIFNGMSMDQSGNNRNIGAAAWVIDHYSVASLISSGLTAREAYAAMQVAVWKAAYDTGNTDAKTVGGSNLWFSGLTDATYTQVTNILTAGLGKKDDAYFVKFAGADQQHPSNQDQIAPVPEPSLVMLLGIGIGFVTLIGLRAKN